MTKVWVVSHLEKKYIIISSNFLTQWHTHAWLKYCKMQLICLLKESTIYLSWTVCTYYSGQQLLLLQTVVVSAEITCHCDNDSWFFHPPQVSLSKPSNHFQHCKIPCPLTCLCIGYRQIFPTDFQKSSHIVMGSTEYIHYNVRARACQLYYQHILA